MPLINDISMSSSVQSSVLSPRPPASQSPPLHALNRISISSVRIVILWSLIKTPVGQNQNEILLYYEYSQEFAVGCLKLQSTVPRYRLGFMNIEIDTEQTVSQSLSSPDDKNIKSAFVSKKMFSWSSGDYCIIFHCFY